MSATIRLASSGDGAALARIYAPAVVGSTISFELTPPDADEMAHRVEKVAGRTPWLVCERDGHVTGYAYAGVHRDRPAYQWTVEVSAYVHPDSHRKGIGRALYTSLLAVLERQGYQNAVAGVTLPNEASIGLHTSLGFTMLGTYRRIGFKLGAWRDVGWLERDIGERRALPTPPVPLAELIGTRALTSAVQAGIALLS